MNRGWLLLVLVWLAGCSTVEPLTMSAGQGLDQLVAVGDSVVVRTNDGTRHKFDVSAVDANWIEGDGRRIQKSDIERLSLREDSPGATAFAVIGIGALVYLVIEVIGGFSDLADSISD